MTESSGSALIFIVSIAFVALLLPMLRPMLAAVVGRVLIPFSRLLLQIFRTLTKPIATVLRFLRIIPSAPKSGFVLGNVVVLAAGTANRAITGGTETDEAIAEGFNTSTVNITRHRQLFCAWLDPELPAKEIPGEIFAHEDYDKKVAQDSLARANEEFAKAKHFFNFQVPFQSNPLNLYEDIDGAFVVRLFKDSDKSCFYVLNAFRKTINGNVLKLTALFSAIASIVIVLNIMYSGRIDLYETFGLEEYTHISLQFSVLGYSIDIRDASNRLMFSLLSCGAGYLAMFLFYHTEYGQFQRNNGRTMTNYLIRYLANININFSKVQAHAAQAVLQEKEVEEMRRDAELWLTNLQWLALRAFFIEYYLRNVIFQIHRNSSYYIVLIPAVFTLLVISVATAFDIPEFNVLDARSNINRQGLSYVVLLLFVIGSYRYLYRSLAFVWESIQKREWDKFHQMNVQHMVADVIGAYVTQLDRWRSMMKART